MGRLLPLALLVALAACTTDSDRAVPLGGTSTDARTMEDEKQREFRAAVDSLEALVTVLESIQDPISAWNQAAAVMRLTESIAGAGRALDMSETEAAEAYPAEAAEYADLEARRVAELERIMEDPLLRRVLLDEASKAERDAGS